MPIRKGVIATVFIGFVLGMLLTPQAPVGSLLWPPSPEVPEPTGTQLPFLMALSLVNALALGAGLALLFFGAPLVRRVPPARRRLARAAHLATVWALVSWVAHDALHIHNGLALAGLIGIEYGFHVTLIGAASVIAAFLVSTLKAAGAADQGAAAPAERGLRAEARQS